VLEQNHPNPFNSSTTIQYQLPQKCHVTVTIYNMMGQKIRTLVQNQFHQAGSHIVSWDGKNELGQAVGSGVYCYQLRAGDFVDSKKLVMMK
jgi:flagellar hook assembly protein FlgD